MEANKIETCYDKRDFLLLFNFLFYTKDKLDILWVTQTIVNIVSFTECDYRHAIKRVLSIIKLYVKISIISSIYIYIYYNKMWTKIETTIWSKQPIWGLLNPN